MSTSKVAVVTGCSEGGIGFYFCQKLAVRGYTVYATSRTLSSTEKLGHTNIKRRVLDVTDDAQVQSVIASVIEESGQIDMLINNAGVLAPGPTIDWKTEDVKAVYDANVFSIVRLCSVVIPHMAKRRKGTIVNMGSIVGEYPTPWMGIYDSSKAAVRLLTEVLLMECKPFDIRVVLVAAAAVESHIIDKHDGFQMAPNSIYGAFRHNVRRRLDATTESAVPTDKFAEEVISQAVRPNPPSYILLGGGATMFRFLAFLPRWIYLSIIWGMFSKPEAKPKRD